jgi:hypothetical protein
MQKECAICGIIFNTENKNRKYCDDCSAHTRSRRDEYERALARSYWRTYEPELHSGVCAQCKKAFKIPTDLLDRPEVKERTQGELEFCSKRCLVDWRHERGLCTNCGAPIDELSGFLPDDLLGRKFCSNRCKYRYMRQEKLSITSLRKCICCGKTFVSNTGLFCGKRCLKKWRDMGGTFSFRTSNVVGDVLVRRQRCDVCGKWTNSIHMLPQEYDYVFPPCACSRKCRKILEERMSTGMMKKVMPIEVQST